MENYIYERLSPSQSIRLIKFLPTATGQITLELYDVPFVPGEMPAYECLSYVWGPPDPKRPIICNGKQMFVTQELDGALYQLQTLAWMEYNMSDYFWVDQISINQEDNAEKSQQVQMMGSIYENAKCVWIWLGQGDEHSVLVMDLLRKSKLTTDVLERDIESFGLETLEEFDIPTKESNFWRSFLQFFHRPWFSRTWTIQEYLLPSDAMVFCGKESGKFDNLLSLIYAYLTYRNMARPTAQDNDDPVRQGGDVGLKNTVTLIDRDWHASSLNAKPPLLHALLDFSTRNATDARDKVYSLLGFASEGSSLIDAGLVPNYDLSQQEVFAQTACALIKVNNNLDVLAAVEHDRPFEDATGPSWVADWGRPRRSQTFARMHKSRFVPYKASPNASLGSKKRISTSTLTLEGSIVDVIAGRSVDLTMWLHSQQRGGESMSPSEVRRLVRDHTHNPNGKYLTGEQIETAVALTLIGNRIGASESMSPKSVIANAEGETQKILAYMKAEVRGADGRLDESDSYYVGIPEEWKWYCSDLRSFSRYRRVFSTPKGYIGLGPACLEIDDVVAVLDGSSVPFVLRRRPGGSEYWLVGECYLHGIMEGVRIFSVTSTRRGRKSLCWFDRAIITHVERNTCASSV